MSAAAASSSAAVAPPVGGAKISKIVFLGTSSAVPVAGWRNTSCLAVVLDTGATILMDCGEGVQHQIQKSAGEVKMLRISAIFITHLHGDHCFGLFGLLCSMGMNGREEPLTVIGPKGIKSLLSTVFQLTASGIPYPLHVAELGGDFPHLVEIEKERAAFAATKAAAGAAADTKQTAAADAKDDHKSHSHARTPAVPPTFRLESESDYPLIASLASALGVKFSIVPLVHRVAAFGLVVTEHDAPGSLDAKKAASLGVTGKDLGLLKAGKDVVVNGKDGTKTTVRSADCVGAVIPGRKFALIQDTSDAGADAVRACSGADVCVHEATYDKSMTDKAIDHGHSTAEMAAKFAKSINAKLLVLSHFSARYSEHRIQPTDIILTDLASEASAATNQTIPVVIARDFMVLTPGKARGVFEVTAPGLIQPPPASIAAAAATATATAAAAPATGSDSKSEKKPKSAAASGDKTEQKPKKEKAATAAKACAAAPASNS